MFVIGIHLTGMYANPIVAWACTFNCGEVPYVTHFVVYWLAPLAAHLAWNKFHEGREVTVSPKEASGEKKTEKTE